MRRRFATRLDSSSTTAGERSHFELAKVTDSRGLNIVEALRTHGPWPCRRRCTSWSGTADTGCGWSCRWCSSHRTCRSRKGGGSFGWSDGRIPVREKTRTRVHINHGGCGLVFDLIQHRDKTWDSCSCDYVNGCAAMMRINVKISTHLKIITLNCRQGAKTTSGMLLLSRFLQHSTEYSLNSRIPNCDGKTGR